MKNQIYIVANMLKSDYNKLADFEPIKGSRYIGIDDEAAFDELLNCDPEIIRFTFFSRQAGSAIVKEIEAQPFGHIDSLNAFDYTFNTLVSTLRNLNIDFDLRFCIDIAEKIDDFYDVFETICAINKYDDLH